MSEKYDGHYANGIVNWRQTLSVIIGGEEVRERKTQIEYTDMSRSLSSLVFSLYKPKPFNPAYNPNVLAKPSKYLVRASSSAAPGIDFTTLESAIAKVPSFLCFLYHTHLHTVTNYVWVSNYSWACSLLGVWRWRALNYLFVKLIAIIRIQ